MMKRWVILGLTALTALRGSGQVDPYLAGRACMVQGYFDSAVVHLNKAPEINPGKAEILYHLGIAYFNLNDNPAARNAFYETEKRQKGMGTFYLAKTEVRLKHAELALKYLREHLMSRYRLPEQQILLDEELSRLVGEPGWRELWNEKDWYSPEDEEFQEALFLKTNGDALEAINKLNRLEKQGYQRSMVQAEKAGIYAQLGNSKAAQSALESAVKSDVRNLDALLKLAAYQVKDGDLDEALTGLDRIIRLQPARFDAYLMRAEARSLNDDLPGALEDIALYLTYFPNSHEAYYQRGLIQYAHRRYLDAIQSFNRALEMDNGIAAYYFARGRTYASTGTTRYAEKDMSMALDLDPYNGEIWFERGKLTEKLGDQERACYCYQKAFQYGVFEAGEILDKRCH
jgi:tetratricopeptide (TPR) repeat protein